MPKIACGQTELDSFLQLKHNTGDMTSLIKYVLPPINEKRRKEGEMQLWKVFETKPIPQMLVYNMRQLFKPPAAQPIGHRWKALVTINY